MKKTFVRTLIALFLLASKAEAAPNGFKDVFYSGTEGRFNVELAFERAPEAIVNYFEKSIRIDVVDGLVSPAKRTFDLNRPDIKSIDVYQYEPRLLRVRITPGGAGMRALRDSFSYAGNGPKLVLNVEKKVKPASTGASEILTQKAGMASKTTLKADEPPLDDEPAIDKPSGAVVVTSPVAEPTVSPAEAAGEGGDYLANIRKNLNAIKNEGAESEKPSLDGPEPRPASFQPQSAALGHAPVVITAPAVRMHLRRLAERFVPGVVVLSYNEVLPGTQLETVGVVGG